jgi:hypothetical protein
MEVKLWVWTLAILTEEERNHGLIVDTSYRE